MKERELTQHGELHAADVRQGQVRALQDGERAERWRDEREESGDEEDELAVPRRLRGLSGPLVRQHLAPPLVQLDRVLVTTAPLPDELIAARAGEEAEEEVLRIEAHTRASSGVLILALGE